MIVGYILWLLLGFLGIHRFYLGKPISGTVMLMIFIMSLLSLTTELEPFGLAVIGVWLIVDIFLIPGLATHYNQKLMQYIQSGRYV